MALSDAEFPSKESGIEKLPVGKIYSVGEDIIEVFKNIFEILKGPFIDI